MTAFDTMSALVSEIVSRASDMSWPVARDAELENISSLHGDTLLKALQAPSAAQEFVLPQRRVALRLRDSIRLLVAAFDNEPDLLSSCRSALWWAGLVRGSLQPVHRADLHLFIVATPPSDQEKSSLRDRSRIEADERLCRKHVWLPALDKGAADFLDATFLARPWHRDALAPQSLDPLQQLVETAGLPAGMAEAWVKALSSVDNVKTDVLAEVLITLYEKVDVS